MLGKVMKYEFKASGRTLLPLFGVSLLAAALVRLLFTLGPHVWEPLQAVINSLAGLLCFVLVVGIVTVTLVVLLVRFYQSMMAGEGYLSFTLPVGAGTHIGGRLIVASVYMLIGCLVTVVCVFIFVPGLWGTMGDIWNTSIPITAQMAGQPANTISFSLSDLGAGTWLNIFGLIFAYAVFGIVSNLLFFYVSMAIGSLANRHKLLLSLGAYFGLNFAESALMMPMILWPMSRWLGADTAAVMEKMNTLTLGQTVETINPLLGIFWGMTAIIMIPTILFAVVHFIASRYLFTKKLNLQ